jgi:hypothetical protein
VGGCSASRRCPRSPNLLRGRSFVVIESVQTGHRDAAFERLRPLRALSPEWDTTATVGPTGLLRLHMDPDRPVPALFDGINLRTRSAAWALPDAIRGASRCRARIATTEAWVW